MKTKALAKRPMAARSSVVSSMRNVLVFVVYSGFFDAARASMDCPPKHTVMVGDDAEVDVAGTLRAGRGATRPYRQVLPRP
jgi:hypothetical protein